MQDVKQKPNKPQAIISTTIQLILIILKKYLKLIQNSFNSPVNVIILNLPTKCGNYHFHFTFFPHQPIHVKCFECTLPNLYR